MIGFESGPTRTRWAPGLRTYWIMVCVRLYSDLPPAPGESEDDPRPAVGYFQNFGATAASEEEVCKLVASQITDGAVLWPSSEVSSDVVTRLHPGILTEAGDWNQKGIWYKSGRVFFPRTS